MRKVMFILNVASITLPFQYYLFGDAKIAFNSFSTFIEILFPIWMILCPIWLLLYLPKQSAFLELLNSISNEFRKKEKIKDEHLSFGERLFQISSNTIYKIGVISVATLPLAIAWQMFSSNKLLFLILLVITFFISKSLFKNCFKTVTFYEQGLSYSIFAENYYRYDEIDSIKISNTKMLISVYEENLVVDIKPKDVDSFHVLKNYYNVDIPLWVR